jgi:chromosome segregation ATPase
MGRPEKASYDVISLAIEKLTASGQDVSLRAVHREVGGSLSTVSKHYNRYIEEKGPIFKKPTEVYDLDEKIKNLINTDIQRKVTIIHEDYQKKLQEIQDSHSFVSENLEKIEGDYIEVCEINSKLEKENFECKGREELIREQLHTIEKAFHDEINEHHELKGRYELLKEQHDNTVILLKETTEQLKEANERASINEGRLMELEARIKELESNDQVPPVSNRKKPPKNK